VPTWKKSDPTHNAFDCCFAWHYRKSGMYLAVYSLLGGLTKGGETSFFSSIEKVAQYFDADYETVRRVFKQLVKTGWLKHGETARNYLWVGHAAWERSHPGKCSVRPTMVWENEADPIVGKLFAIAGGKFRLYPNHLVALRKFASDDVILHNYTATVAAAARDKANGLASKDPRGCFWQVYHRLKLLAKQAKSTVENAGSRQG
jgi:hypothetical protein